MCQKISETSNQFSCQGYLTEYTKDARYWYNRRDFELIFLHR